MAVEWAQHNIRVNSVSPGPIRTRLTDAINNTEEKMKDFPTLEESILTGEFLTITGQEYKELYDLLEEIRNIEYMGKYYKVRFLVT